MTMEGLKKNVAGLYLCICLLAMSGEPQERVSFVYVIGYYTFVLLNFALSSYIINKIYKNEASKDRN